MFLEQINYFQLTDGAFTLGQSYIQRFAIIQQKMNDIIGDSFTPSVRDYLNSYSTVEQTNIDIQRSYNELEVAVSALTPARQSIHSQAEYFLTEALQDAYVQPAKYMMMQAVTTGVTIKKAQSILRNWNNGTMTNGKLASGRQTPALQRYAGVIARDSIYKMNGAINQVIAEKYNLDHFVYNGSLIEGSRPLCRHLVNLRRTISLDEMPALIKRYPQGLYPNTTRDNFMNVTGGFGCLHTATAVKKRQ